MTQGQPFSPAARAKSFVYAFRGLALVARTQHNMWLHVAIGLAVGGAGFWLGLSRAEWLWLIASIAFVLFAEIMNSAFEFLCDVVTKEFNPDIAAAKDIAAGAVLVAAFGAFLAGVLIFWPHLAG